MSESGMDASATAHAETAATLGEAVLADTEAVPDHIRRALDGDDALSAGYRILRAAAVLVLAALLLIGIAWSAGLLPGPLAS